MTEVKVTEKERLGGEEESQEIIVSCNTRKKCFKKNAVKKEDEATERPSLITTEKFSLDLATSLESSSSRLVRIEPGICGLRSDWEMRKWQ